jgi:hypothetical protein
MFFSTGLEQVDPALLAFVKCHVTSALKWEALRVLAAQEGAWVHTDALARTLHKRPNELTSTLAELVAEELIEEQPGATPEELSYRLGEATTVVLKRLIDVATHSQELRAIIVANLQTSRLRTSISPAAA